MIRTDGLSSLMSEKNTKKSWFLIRMWWFPFKQRQQVHLSRLAQLWNSMLANSKQTFRFLGILQLLNTFSISSFLAAKNSPWINADNACIAFDNALTIIKIKIGHSPCYFTGNFPRKDCLCFAWPRSHVLYQNLWSQHVDRKTDMNANIPHVQQLQKNAWLGEINPPRKSVGKQKTSLNEIIYQTTKSLFPNWSISEIESY